MGRVLPSKPGRLNAKPKRRRTSVFYESDNLDGNYRPTGDSFAWGQGWASSGVHVNVKVLWASSVARRCIEAIAQDLAAMPLDLVRIGDDDYPAIQKTDPRHGIFKWSPDNGITTPIRFREAIIGNALANGAGLAEIAPSPDRSAYALYIINSPSVTFHDIQGRPPYYVTNKGNFDYKDVIHVAGLGTDGLNGIVPWQTHRGLFGLNHSLQEYGGGFMASGLFMGGFLECGYDTEEEEWEKFRDDFQEAHGGWGKAGRLGLLPPGFKFNAATVSPEQAQLVDWRVFMMLEICRVFGVPPHRVMEYRDMHYSTVEAVKSEFAQTTLFPWARIFEESLNLKLLDRDEVMDGMTYRHDFASYLRADTAGRATLYSTMFNIGALSPDEVRVQEGYPKRGDAGGRAFYLPATLKPSDASLTTITTADPGVSS